MFSSPISLELTDGSILIAIVAGVSPLLMAWVTARLARNRQREDWARQDLVAERAKVDAAAQAKAQARMTQQADEAAILLERLHEMLDQRAAATTAGEEAARPD